MKIRFLCFFSFLSTVYFLSGCFVMDNKYTKVAPGIWRAVLQLENNQVVGRQKLKPFEKPDIKYEEVIGGELPFQFEVKYTSDSVFDITIWNGEERIKVDAVDILTGHDRSSGKDTILIKFPIFDSYIHAVYQENVMEGEWIVPAKKTSIPFSARNGKAYRFSTLAKTPAADLTGKWEATFGVNDSLPEKAVGEFKQTGNTLRGTFRTETGDYRFLDGEVQAERFYLSCFDGSHAFLFEGEIKPDGSLIGSYRSGKYYQTIWIAKKNEQFELSNPDSLTVLKQPSAPMDIHFINPEGVPVSLTSPFYINKVKIIQIMGTWCPNCRDETNFLKKYLRDHSNTGVSVIALAYERYPDSARANAQIRVYKEKMQVPYEIVDAGTANKTEASKTLPELNKIQAFPTTLVLDRKNKVRHIHTGFDGPATSKYSAFKEEFAGWIDQLLAEK